MKSSEYLHTALHSTEFPSGALASDASENILDNIQYSDIMRVNIITRHRFKCALELPKFE